MEWSKVRPKVPGFYWHYQDIHRYPGNSWAMPMMEMVEIRSYIVDSTEFHKEGKNAKQELFVESIYNDDSGASKLSEYKESYHFWMGPTEPPIPPKSEVVGEEQIEYEREQKRMVEILAREK